ncbi:MAG: hypothetical protein JXB32_22460 [Deltaproteobacteria bacterium]|nr:hypothetical protein [Deltaproteobacteria bacterium]
MTHRTRFGVVGRGTVAALSIALALGGCDPKRPGGRHDDAGYEPPAVPEGAAPPVLEPGTTVFVDDFSAGRLDPAVWNATRPVYEVRDGALHVREAKNHPLWLGVPLPCNVQLDFTARSGSPDGDIKFEVFGDGRSFARQASYAATGYVFLFGGWRNSVSAIVRQDEHRARMVTDESRRVEPGRTYRFTVRIRGGSIDWSIDGEPFLHADDPVPLCGAGRAHFAFNDWSVPLVFDDLTITALGE